MLARYPAPRYVYCPAGSLFHRQVGGQVVAPNAVGHVAGKMRDYIPAEPAVAPDASKARVVAAPTANSGVAERLLATPSVAGPAPKDLGIADALVTPVPRDDQGLWRARQAAQPRWSDAGAVGTRASLAPVPASEAPIPRQVPFGARNLEPVARAPQYQGIAPRHIPPPPVSYASHAPAYSAPGRFEGGPAFSHPNFAAAPAMRAPGPTMPSHVPNHLAGHFAVGPSIFTGPAPSFASPGPAFAPPSFVSSPGPSFVSSPGPSFVSSPGPSFVSTPGPSFVSSPGPSFVSSPAVSGGGFVGAQPSVVSSPGPARDAIR
jgi:hypothetical protein